jgi:hypothetical protein
MLKVMSLYDKNPEAWDLIATYNPACADMARNFNKLCDMQAALGYSKGTIRNWIKGHCCASGEAERRAEEWAAKRKVHRVISIAPQRIPALMLVKYDTTKAARLQSLLQGMGCEVTAL